MKNALWNIIQVYSESYNTGLQLWFFYHFRKLVMWPSPFDSTSLKFAMLDHSSHSYFIFGERMFSLCSVSFFGRTLTTSFIRTSTFANFFWFFIFIFLWLCLTKQLISFFGLTLNVGTHICQHTKHLYIFLIFFWFFLYFIAIFHQKPSGFHFWITLNIAIHRCQGPVHHSQIFLIFFIFFPYFIAIFH